MKKSILMALAIVAILLTVPRDAFATRFSERITVTAGTAIQISKQQIFAKRLFIQMAVGGTGYGCIIAAPNGTTGLACSSTAFLVAQLAPASSTAPGGSYSDPNGAPGGISLPDIDLSTIFLDGSVNSDPITVSYEF